MSRRDKVAIGATVVIAVVSSLRIPLWLMGYTGVIVENGALGVLLLGIAIAGARALSIGRIRLDGVLWMAVFCAWAGVRFLAEGSLAAMIGQPIFYPVGVAIFYVLCIQVFSFEQAQWALKVLGATLSGGALLAGVLWVQKGASLLAGNTPIVRMDDFFVDINSASYIAAAGTLFIFFQLRRNLTASRLLLWAPAIALLGCVPILNATRGAAVLVVAQIGLFAVAALVKKDTSASVRALPVVGLVISASFLFSFIGGENVVDLLYTRFTGDSFYGYALDTVRAGDSEIARSLWAANPLIGAGSLASTDPRYIHGNHNYFLAVAASLGLVGLVLFCLGIVGMGGGVRALGSYEGVATLLFVCIVLSLAPLDWYVGPMCAYLHLCYSLRASSTAHATARDHPPISALAQGQL